MKYCNDRGIREALYRAFSTRAAEFDGGRFDNTPLMTEILKLRREEASLLGFPNFAALSLATKMAESPEAVLEFLRDLARRSKSKAEADVREVNEFARSELGLDKVEPWDRLRKRKASRIALQLFRRRSEALLHGAHGIRGTL